MSENILEIPDAYSRLRVSQGLSTLSEVKMSKYITFVKARKIVRALSEMDIAELNEIIFGENLNKFNKWTKDKLLSKLDHLDHVKWMRFLYVREKEGLTDSLLCLLGKKKFDFDQKFLTNFFKYGTALK